MKLGEIPPKSAEALREGGRRGIKIPWVGIIVVAACLLGGLIIFKAGPAAAQGAWDQWREYVPGGLRTDRTLADYIQSIINAALLLAAVIAVAYLIVGGYKYITAAGNAEGVAEAKTTILNAIIGLVIIFAAYVIVDFVYRIITHGSIWGVFNINIGGGGSSGGNTGGGGTPTN